MDAKVVQSLLEKMTKAQEALVKKQEAVKVAQEACDAQKELCDGIGKEIAKEMKEYIPSSDGVAKTEGKRLPRGLIGNTVKDILKGKKTFNTDDVISAIEGKGHTASRASVAAALGKLLEEKAIQRAERGLYSA